MFLEGEVLGRGQRHLRCDQTFHYRVVGQIEVHRHVIGDAAFLKGTAEVLRDVIFDAHRGEDDAELLVGAAAQVCLTDDLCRQLIVRQTVSGENRKLLAADQRGQTVDGGDAGVDVVPRIFPAAGIQRQSVDVVCLAGDDGPQTVDGAADAVEGTAEDILGERHLHRMAGEPRVRVRKAHAGRALEDLDDRPVIISFDDAAQLLLLLVDRELHDLVEGRVLHALQHDQRAVDIT